MPRKIMNMTTILSILACILFFTHSLYAAPQNTNSSHLTAARQKDSQKSKQLSSSNNSLSTTRISSKNPQVNTKNATKEEQEKSNRDQAKDSNASLALILKSIQLSQGQDGSELWRLSAKTAQIEQLEENFLVECPQLTYIMKPNDTELHVSSNKGIINQKEQVLQFKDNVLITHMNNSIKGNLLVYNGTQKTMTFPDGGSFVGKNIKGSAKVVLWHLDTQKIEAKGNVNITFSPDAS